MIRQFCASYAGKIQHLLFDGKADVFEHNVNEILLVQLNT